MVQPEAVWKMVTNTMVRRLIELDYTSVPQTHQNTKTTQHTECVNGANCVGGKWTLPKYMNHCMCENCLFEEEGDFHDPTKCSTCNGPP